MGRGLKDLDFRKIERIVLICGFEKQKTGKSSHVKYRRGSETITLSHLGVNRMMWRRLCKEHNLPLK